MGSVNPQQFWNKLTRDLPCDETALLLFLGYFTVTGPVSLKLSLSVILFLLWLLCQYLWSSLCLSVSVCYCCSVLACACLLSLFCPLSLFLSSSLPPWLLTDDFECRKISTVFCAFSPRSSKLAVDSWVESVKISVHERGYWPLLTVKCVTVSDMVAMFKVKITRKIRNM